MLFHELFGYVYSKLRLNEVGVGCWCNNYRTLTAKCYIRKLDIFIEKLTLTVLTGLKSTTHWFPQFKSLIKEDVLLDLLISVCKNLLNPLNNITGVSTSNDIMYKPLCHTLSKAFEMSQKMNFTSVPLSKFETSILYISTYLLAGW